jgi:S1-C subfamily serine protease
MLKWEDVTRIAIRLNGVPVLGCRPGSPAARAGVQYGDILMAVNGAPTPDWASFIEARAKQRGTMLVEVFRAGEILRFDLTLPAPGEPVDPLAMLEELLEAGTMPMITSDRRRDPEPS